MFRESLNRTRQAVFGRIVTLLGASELDDQTWDDLEALLIKSDMGVETALEVVEALKQHMKAEGFITQQQLRGALKDSLLARLPSAITPALGQPGDRLLTVVLIVGVNGSGKTTTIGKLAKQMERSGWRVMLAAADTFRAAAIEQLQQWGGRIGVPVIAGQSGGDPGAVTYDAIRAARARDRNVLIVDTAGRLHTKYNLMEELKKVHKVVAKNVHDAPHEVLLVVDGTTGQNALAQARHFRDAVGVTGVLLTKLDSTAKGGIVFAIGHELGLPVRYVGVGEGEDDLIPFDPETFVTELLEP